MKYITRSIIVGVLLRLMNKFRVQTYNIGIIRKDFIEIKNELAPGEIVWLRHPYKDRYFADPFLLRQDENNFFILAEEYIFWEEKGKIVLLTIDKNSFTLKKKSLLIEESFHISYPFCEENGRIITVEASASGLTYECYLSADGANVQGRKIIAYTGLIDQTLFIKDNIEWILATDIDKPLSHLNIYYREAGMDHFAPIAANPAKDDIKTSRPAGRMFYVDSRLIRPVQDNEKTYGHRVKLMEVYEISKQGIEEKEIITLSSIQNGPYNETFHTFNVYNGFIIVDGSRHFIRFPMKLAYKAAILLVKAINKKRNINPFEYLPYKGKN